MIDDDFVQFLKADPAIDALADEIAVGYIPADDNGQPYVDTYIWVGQFDETDFLDLDGKAGLTEFRFNVESCSIDQTTSKTLGRLVKKRCQGYGYNQPMGDTTVQGIFVESKDEDYVPINRFQEREIAVMAYDVAIFADDAADDQQ